MPNSPSYPPPSSTFPSLPSISSLPSLPLSAQASVLSALFEPCADLQSLALPLLSNCFDSYAGLIAAVNSQLTSLAESFSPSNARSLDNILNAHPRLGERKLESVRSSAEQASLDEESDGLASLRELNERYEQAFPGLRYVVFVNGRGRDEILTDMCLRIEQGDIQMERRQAIEAMCDIAADRARKSSMR